MADAVRRCDPAYVSVRQFTCRSQLVVLAHKLSDSLEKEVWNGEPRTAAATAYAVILRAAAVVTAASWSTVCKEEAANQQHNPRYSYSHNGGYQAVVGEAYRAICRLLVRSLAAVSSDGHVLIGTAGSTTVGKSSAKGSSTNDVRLALGQHYQALGCAADVLNAAVKCLQQAEVSGGGLTQLPTIDSLPQQQQATTTAMAARAPVTDFQGILGLVANNSSQLQRLTSAHKYPGVTAREVVAGVRGAQQRVLDLASAALTHTEGEGPEAEKLRKLVRPALAVSRNAGQLMGKALQVSYIWGW